jgi:hypothetical protein
VNEVVAFAQQWLTQADGRCIREAIPIVESSAMTSLAVAAESERASWPCSASTAIISILAREMNRSRSRDPSAPYLSQRTCESNRRTRLPQEDYDARVPAVGSVELQTYR